MMHSALEELHLIVYSPQGTLTRVAYVLVNCFEVPYGRLQGLRRVN